MTSVLRRILPAAGVMLACASLGTTASAADARAEYESRVTVVRSIPGFVALWDFVQREDGPAGTGRFIAHTAPDVAGPFALDAVNIIRAFWRTGREASYADFPLSGRGPFGNAVRFQEETEPDFLPTLLVPRAAIHDSRLDVKGPGGSVSMAVWVLHERGDHVLAGIWHEGTDLQEGSGGPAVVERGRRQYALFAGLAGNPGAAAVHVSENGGASFSDKYARNLAVTPDKIPHAATTGNLADHDAKWAVAGFVFDNDRDTATAYLNGRAAEHWIDNPAEHPFFRWPAKGWRQAQLARLPGVQPGEDPDYPPDQYYEPPESQPLSESVVSESDSERIVLLTFEFTKVRVTSRRGEDGRFAVVERELAALKVNPYWFGHDLYAPNAPAEGGPFTIGRVIKTSRGQGNTAFYGGVAVFDRALSAEEMAALAGIGRPLLSLREILASR